MTVAVIQARMGSTRLPGKVLRPLASGTTLSWVVRAARASGVVDEIVVATTDDPTDEVVGAAAGSLGCRPFFGPADDVLSRFLLALAPEPDERIALRLTADCPLLDPVVLATAVRAFAGSGLDYLSTVSPRSLPRGLDVEITTVGTLRAIDPVASGVERVHVTPHLYRNPGRYRIAGIVYAPDASDLRVTLDTREDARLIDAVVERLGDHPADRVALVELLRAHPELADLNRNVRQRAIEEG